MVVVIGGVIATLVGLWMLVGSLSWGEYLMMILKGCIPAIFIIGGIVAIVTGISNIKDEAISAKKKKALSNKKD